jgi:hypothetical protein
MPTQVTFNIDMREFNQALDRYMDVTTRSLPDVLNKKALYIARGALRRTPSTEKGAITSSLGQIIHKKSGVELKLRKGGEVYSNLGSKEANAPMAALIINARRGRADHPGLYGQEMTQAIEALIAARNRSRAFLKSGWIPAIRTLSPLVKDSYGFDGANGRAVQVNRAKGMAVPARAGFDCQAIIENSASGDHETNQALHKYGRPALQEAFNAEAASMNRLVADRQYEEARRIGIRAVVS